MTIDWRAGLGWWLRRAADRVDPTREPRSPFSYTFEPGEGIRLRWDGRGCPVWYFGEADRDRAHAEADGIPVTSRQTYAWTATVDPR